MKIRKFEVWPPYEDKVGFFPTDKKGMLYRFESWTPEWVMYGFIGKDRSVHVEGSKPNPFKSKKERKA